MKFGLVVQGSLISAGRTGKIPLKNRKDLTEDDIVKFECIENIVKIKKQCSEKNVKFICVVWSNEEKTILDKLFKILGSENILLIDDLDTNIKYKGLKINPNDFNNVSYNEPLSLNKYRQIISSLEGIEYLIKSGCETILKLRSDQNLDIEKLFNDFLRVKNKRNLKIMVPAINTKKLYTLTDWWMCGNAMDLRRIFNFYISSNEYNNNVHIDYFFKFFFSNHKFLYFLFTKFPFFFGKKKILYIWNEFYCPSSLDVFNTAEFRGEKIEHIKEENIFIENLNDSFFLKENNPQLVRSKYIHYVFNLNFKYKLVKLFDKWFTK